MIVVGNENVTTVVASAMRYTIHRR
jgi:hypothetical protein